MKKHEGEHGLETVKVKVKYFSLFQNITGKTEEHIRLKKSSMEGLMEFLEKEYQSNPRGTVFSLKSAKHRMEFMISVNGKPSDLERSLEDDDEVAFLPPMGGG